MSKKRIPCYILTFPGAGETRQQSARNEAEKISHLVDWQLVMGYSRDDKALRDSHSAWRNFFFHERQMSDSEVAVYLGHRKMMQMFLDSDAEFALILEDDFKLADKPIFEAVLENLNACFSDCDLLKLFNNRNRWKKNIVFERDFGAFTLFRAKSPPSGFVAYIINRKAAGAILERQKVFRPADNDVRYFYEFGIRVGIVQPDPMVEAADELGGSMLSPTRKKMGRSQPRWLKSVRKRLNLAYHRLNWNRNP